MSLSGRGRCPTSSKSSYDGVNDMSWLVKRVFLLFFGSTSTPTPFNFWGPISVLFPSPILVLLVIVIRSVELRFVNKILQVSDFDKVFNLIFQDTPLFGGVSSIAIVLVTF